MDILGTSSELCSSRSEERILAAFTQRLIEITAIGARGTATFLTTTLNAMRLPAISLDKHGSVIDANAAAEVVFDDNIRIKHRRLFVRDMASRTRLQEAINQLSSLNAWALEPVMVPRMDKLPVIVRIWPCEPSHPPAHEARALLTLNALGPRPGPPAAILAKAFHLTPSPAIAARELKIARETARNQLKSVFAKTDTHRQSELVALLLQVGNGPTIYPNLAVETACQFVEPLQAKGVRRRQGPQGDRFLSRLRGDGHPSGVVPHRNRRHHHIGSRVDHRNIVVDFICDALEGARTRRACSLVRSSLPPGDAKTSNRANGGRLLPLGDASVSFRWTLFHRSPRVAAVDLAGTASPNPSRLIEQAGLLGSRAIISGDRHASAGHQRRGHIGGQCQRRGREAR
jgi:hypothetical protein